MTVFSWIFTAVSVAAAIHTILLMMTTRWSGTNVRLMAAGTPEGYRDYMLRIALPPWYVRYAAWAHRIPLPTIPQNPEGVRLVDVYGVEHEPTRVVYTGPDLETGIHMFEVWFPSDIELDGPFPPTRVAKLPGRTSLAFRFEP